MKTIAAILALSLFSLVAKSEEWNEMAARQIVASTDQEGSRAVLAQAILCRTHPSGNNPAITAVQTFMNPDGNLVAAITLEWFGMVTNTHYTTIVTWKMNSQRHLCAAVTFDNAVVKVSKENKLRLNEYFQRTFDSMFPVDRR